MTLFQRKLRVFYFLFLGIPHLQSSIANYLSYPWIHSHMSPKERQASNKLTHTVMAPLFFYPNLFSWWAFPCNSPATSSAMHANVPLPFQNHGIRNYRGSRKRLQLLLLLSSIHKKTFSIWISSPCEGRY